MLAILTRRLRCCLQNLNYVNPLQRTQMTIAALINTGSLWLYEGPGSNSPAPLLVARVIGRDVQCLAVPTTLMVQPYDGDPAAHIPPYNCSNLEAGAMLPPGFWSGGVSASLCDNCCRSCSLAPQCMHACMHGHTPQLA